MFADTLLDLERAHLIRLMLWAGASLLTGTGILAVLAVRRTTSPMLSTFGLVTAAWGAVELAAAVAQWSSLALRDLAGATQLNRLLWLESGLDVALIAVSATIAVAAWRLGRRPGWVGGGVGTVAQGAALLALHARLALYLSGKV
jgi:hypothetical protein